MSHSPRCRSVASIPETLFNRLQSVSIKPINHRLEESDPHNNSQEKIVAKIFSGFKVASDARRSNVNSVLNRVRQSNLSRERSQSSEQIPQLQQRKKLSKKTTNKESSRRTSQDMNDMMGDGHVFFKHNKMVNLKSQLTSKIYRKSKHRNEEMEQLDRVVEGIDDSYVTTNRNIFDMMMQDATAKVQQQITNNRVSPRY